MHSISRRNILIGGGIVTAGTIALEGFVTSPSFASFVPTNGDWPARRRGPERTASMPEANPPSSIPMTAWIADDVGEVVVGGGTVFAGNQSRVQAFAPETGTRLWETAVPGEYLSYWDGDLYCAGTDGPVARLGADRGEKRWTVATECSTPVHDLLVSGQTAFIGTDGTLIARDAESGTSHWQLDVRDTGAVFPAVTDGMLYLGGPGPFEVYRPRSGWGAILHDGPRFAAHSYWEAAQVTYPVVGDHAIYAGSAAPNGSEPTVQAFSRDGINRLWDSVHGLSLSSPALAEGVGIVSLSARGGGSEHHLLGIDLDTGSTLWNRQMGASLTRPVVAGALAVVGDSDGTLAAIDPETGERAWRTTLDSSVRTVVPTGERLLIVDYQDQLRCLR